MKSNTDKLRDMCLNCTRPECPDNGCDAYRAARAGKSEHPGRNRHYVRSAAAASNAQNITADTLRRVNNAIGALEELIHDPAAEQFMAGCGNAQKLLSALRQARFDKCNDAIDWSLVADNLKKEMQSK